MKKFMQVVRTLHLYLSMLGVVFVLFFAITGFLVNHEDFFKLNDVRSVDSNAGTLARDMVPFETALEMKLPEPARAKIERALRAKYGLRGVMTEPVVSENTVEFNFESPGRSTNVKILLADPQGEPDADHTLIVREEDTGLRGRISEMHRKITKSSEEGQYVGRIWRLVVDGVAIVFVITSITGVILWLGASRRRWLAAISLLGGAALLVVAYVVLVP